MQHTHLFIRFLALPTIELHAGWVTLARDSLSLTIPHGPISRQWKGHITLLLLYEECILRLVPVKIRSLLPSLRSYMHRSFRLVLVDQEVTAQPYASRTTFHKRR
jgi:hypothetical protein